MTVHYSDDMVTLIAGDALAAATSLETGSVQTIVTSPPYFGLRDYDMDGQIGDEGSVGEYIARLVELFGELRRVLADDGTLWVNIGDSYASRWGSVRSRSKLDPFDTERSRRPLPRGATPKQLLMVPARVAIALQDDGWLLRSDIIWAKPNPMPEGVTDRPSKSHEHVFLFSKSTSYLYDFEAVAEPIAESSAARLAQNVREQAGSARAAGRPERPMKPVSSDRPQRRRAEELAEAAGLTPAHLAAIRAVGIADTGKALVTTSGAGSSSAEMQALAAEAKVVLGGYYREFLTGDVRRQRDVWTIPTASFSGAHFAVWPEEIPRRCILAGSRPGDAVLDPFSGSGTTGKVAVDNGRRYVGIDLNAKYLDDSLRTRFAQPSLGIEVGS